MADGKTKKKNIRSLKVANSLMILSTAPMLVVAIILIIFSSVTEFNSLRNSSEKQLLSTAKGIASEISNSSEGAALTLDGETLNINGVSADYMKSVITEVNDETGTLLTFYYDKNAYYSNVTTDLNALTMDSNVYSVVITGSHSYLKYNLDLAGEKYVAAFAPIITENGTEGAVLAALPASDVTRQARNALILSIILIIIICAILCYLSFLVARRLSKVVDRVRDTSKSLSEGNLKAMQNDKAKQELDKVASRQDEFGEFVRNTENVSGKLRETVISIQNQADDVKVASSRLSELSSNVADISESVTTAVSDISNGANDQAAEVQNSAGNVSNITAKMDAILQNVESADNTSKDMANYSATAHDNFEKLMAAMIDTTSAINEIAGKMKNVHDAVKNVNMAVSAINDIANQTNLLSLNASIEAARAGEAGRGFAVVAENIQALSTQSKDSADSISKIMATLSKDTDAAFATISNLSATVEGQMKQGWATKESMESLVSSINDTREKFSTVEADCSDVTERCKSLNDSISNLSAISEENAASTEETNSSMESINASIVEISSLAENLKNVSDNLSEALDFFKL